MTENENFPTQAWISCRETWPDSLGLGEVVLEEANVWESAGSLPKSGKIVGKLAQGTIVTVVDKAIQKDSKTVYYKISTDILNGWISEMFLSWQWSSFTFVGNLKPADACRNLSISITHSGIHFFIRNNGFALLTEGDPSQFEIIYKAVSKFIDRIINAQAPLTQIPLQANFDNWVEVPIGGNEREQGKVGFLSIESDNTKTISDTNIQDAYSIVPLLEISPYFDLALNDFYQALRYPQHALIFLARAIESIENHFAGMAKSDKSKGKEKIMRDLLEVKRRDVEYITRRANDSHRRHASSSALAEELASEELAECFHKTANILAAFARFLRPQSFSISE